MIDILEAENRIGEYFIELGLVVDEDGDISTFALDWPLRIVAHHGRVACTASIYEDFKGLVVLGLEAEVATVDDGDELRRWATSRGSLSFAKPRLDMTSDGRVRVVAVHHLLADSVTRGAIECVVNAIAAAATQWGRMLDEEALDSGTAPARLRRVAPSPGGIDEVLAELDAMVGLGSVKKLVQRLVSTQTVATLRGRNGMTAVRPSPHLVFTGNPGTGKTTVARHIGRLYREIGVLSQGHMVEVDRSDLIAGYVGQTALKTKSVLESASGGVLFIDEAYSLVGEGLSDYGAEAIEMILTHMENNRGDIAVVVAGYPEEMSVFMDCNPGLASRFDYTLEFADFTDDELETIFLGLIARYDYALARDAMPALRSSMTRLRRGRGFGNAREIRKLFHDAVAAHSEWVVEQGITSGPELGTLRADHVGPFKSGSPAAARGSAGGSPPGYL